MDKFLLRILMKLVRAFFSKGVDVEKVQVIASTKLMMDRRRSPASWKLKQRKEPKNPLLLTLIMYSFLGIFISAFSFILNSLILSMIFIHSYLLFMMAMTLITDFSSVLLDTADNQLLLPRPVSSRTLFMSRVVHILVYLSQFFLALTIAPILFTFVKYGVVAGLVTIITLLLTVAFAIFLTCMLYALVLRFGNEQKIKDIVGYFQIVMTVLFAVGYQIIPQLVDFDNLNLSFELHWYSYLLPPIWMAVTVEAFQKSNFDSIHLLMIFCAVVIPVFTVWFMVKFVTPSFSHKLGMLGTNNGSTKPVTTKGKRRTLSNRLASIFCVSKPETAGFEKTWKITSRDKSFKIQFYPSLAYLLVFVFIFIFKTGRNFSQTWDSLSGTKMYLWFVYLPLMGVSSSLHISYYYENFQAAWIYQSAPLNKPGHVISGAVKSLFIKFFIPVYLVLFTFCFYVWGAMIIDDFVYGFFNNLLLFLIMSNLSQHILPFSREPNLKQQSGRLVHVFMQLILVAILIGLHYLALKQYWLPLALTPVSAVGAWWLSKRLQDLPWKKITV